MNNIIWNGPLLDPSGYGNCAREYVCALWNNDVNVVTDPVMYYRGNPKQYMDSGVYELMRKLTAKYSGVDFSLYNHVEHKTPNVLSRTNYRKNIGYTVWETNRVPDRAVFSVNSKDEIWTSSEYSKKAFVDSGVTVPIYIIPHIINTDVFYSNGRVSNDLTFLYNGEFTYRKGVDILIKSYLKTFTNKDNVMLLLKTYLLDNKTSGSNYIRSKINEWTKEVNPSNPPKIKILTDLISDSVLHKLYEPVDVFVSMTRGEGFGLPIAEAMSSQKLVVVPDKGGHRDFCNTSNSLLVESNVVDIPEDMLEPERKVYRGQKWIEPSLDHLVSIFKSIHDNYNSYEDLRAKARNTIIEQCSATKVIDLIKERLI